MSEKPTNMNLKIKPDIYPMAYPLKETIGICDTGDINDPEEFQIFITILNHEYLHIFLYQLEGDEANVALDNLPITIEEKGLFDERS